MKQKTMTTCALFLLLSCNVVWAESLRIEVYSISQQYWDVIDGETLSGIAAKLLPNNPHMQQKLMDDIIRLNPDSFIGGDKNRLLSNVRIWLPSHMKRADSKVDKTKYDVKSFTWGNIKRLKEQHSD